MEMAETKSGALELVLVKFGKCLTLDEAPCLREYSLPVNSGHLDKEIFEVGGGSGLFSLILCLRFMHLVS